MRGLQLIGRGLASWALTLVTSGIAIAVEIDVGVVQRFGDEPTERLEIAGTNGQSLTVAFQEGDRAETLRVPKVALEIAVVSLAEPEVREQVVLADTATFETAEAAAKEWEARGIPVEIVQPDRWQVWAARETYRTPLLRRLLLTDLQEQGYAEPRLESEVLEAAHQVLLNVGTRRIPLQEVKLESASNRLTVADNGKTQLYAGHLRLQPNAYGDYTLVNRVDIEDYLRGVVPYEIAPEAPQRAIEAQSIIARTYALRNLRRFKADGYELCATVHCQVYKGLSGSKTHVDRAVAATAGQVLTYNGELVDALYSSTTGGVTASFEDIWDGQARPYLRASVDAPGQPWDLQAQSLADEATFQRFINLQQGFNETGTRAFRWRKTSNLEDLGADLRKYLERVRHPQAGFAALEGLEIVSRSPSGRILQMDIRTDLGAFSLYKTEVRSALGPPRSTLFYIEPVRDEAGSLSGYTFVGGGLGHGVGLSQYGSYNLARLGWSAQQILAFYYPGAQLQALDDSIVFYNGD